MQKCLLVLACLSHHAHARRVRQSIDDQDNTHAIAALLHAVNPSVSMTPAGAGGEHHHNKAAVVQGKSLKTWSYRSSVVDRVQVVLSTDGRPLDADIQLWQGPDNTPCKMRVYSEDGNIRPFSAIIATPDDGENTVAVRNIGEMVFPLAAVVVANDVDEPVADFVDTSMIVQGGGALRTYEFNNPVESVEIMLKTDGRPLNARVELLEGPNNIKQVIELYTEDGLERPFFAIVDTKGMGNVVRVVNTAPLEFPMFASVQPHNVGKMKRTDQKHVTSSEGVGKHVYAPHSAQASKKHFTGFHQGGRTAAAWKSAVGRVAVLAAFLNYAVSKESL